MRSPSIKTVSGWHYLALCAKPENRDLPWFLDDEPASYRRTLERKKALRVCAECPVQRECRAFAQALDVTCGIWAGKVYGPRRERRGNE